MLILTISLLIWFIIINSSFNGIKDLKIILFITLAISLFSINFYLNNFSKLETSLLNNLFFTKADTTMYLIDNAMGIIDKIKSMLVFAINEEIIKFSVGIITYLFLQFSNKNKSKSVLLITAFFISYFSFYLIENILYIFSSNLNTYSTIIRFINPTHFIFPLLLMVFFDKYSKLNYKMIIISFIIASFAHTTANSLAEFNFYGTFLIFISLVAISSIIIFFKFSEEDTTSLSKYS